MNRSALRACALAATLAATVGLSASPLRAQAQDGPRVTSARMAVAHDRTASPIAEAASLPDATPLRAEGPDRPSLWRHVGVGALGGAVLGLALGLYADSNCFDCTISGTVLSVPAGAVAGSLVGGIVWFVRTTD